MAQDAVAVAGPSQGPASCVVISLVLTAVVVLLAPIGWVILLSIGAAAIAALVASCSRSRAPAWQLGLAAVLGGGVPFAVWVALHLGDDAATPALIVGWIFTMVTYVIVIGGVATLVAWGGRAYRRHRQGTVAE